MKTLTERERCLRDLRDAIGRRLASDLAPERAVPDAMADLLRQLDRLEKSTNAERPS